MSIQRFRDFLTASKVGIHMHRPVIMDAGFRRHDSRGFGVSTDRENALGDSLAISREG